MAKLKSIVRMLEAQRVELLKQLDAIDRALAALGSAGMAVAEAPLAEADVPAEDAARTVPPRQVKAPRVLTDSHKRALTAGRRRARETRDVAKGLAREMPDDGFVPAIGKRADRQPPRLVKRPIKE
jgi:hypothetical protein